MPHDWQSRRSPNPAPGLDVMRAQRAMSGTGWYVIGRTLFKGHASGGNGGERSIRLGLPQSQVLEDAPHHRRVLDQRDDAHRVVTFRAFERIGFVDLADHPRPG